ncbi:response regulator transcription factor [Gordonia alkaliphila]|uniref:response regulator transcription factor n=1 Tax=Gordonia alkaliphila TaxID=1053547 RepID=UPI001FF5E252|nr:response regulator transcription factor [Gordonia alkaliphila]MCK0440069.1 response regulator transcription factor [Gordonia alkaliphila]
MTGGRAILLGEDDPAIAQPLARALKREGNDCTVVESGPAALAAAVSGAYALVILDLGLPGMDGLEVCRRIRVERPQLAVLMLTARTDEVDFVVGLDAGADDYVGKPFRLAELLARVRALLRRSAGADDVVLDSGDLQLDARARRVVMDGRELTLANREFDLLRCLMETPGQVRTRDEIMTEVWGSTDLRSSKTLDMHISWVRRKLGDDQPGRRKHIATVRGVGFRFDP